MPRKKNRPAIIVGNWKMYKTIEEATHYIETLTPLIKQSQASVYLAVPFTAIVSAFQCIEAIHSPIKVGAQNMHDATEGAFTGEIAARMLKEAGATFVILGHSERRTLFHEEDTFINKKVKKALQEKIEPILCIGETKEQRGGGEKESVLQKQLLKGLSRVTAKEMTRLVIAYEPVWSIGSGKVADPTEIQDTHHLIRSFLEEKWGWEVAQEIPILYGGSVTTENAEQLLQQEDVGGVLIGGATLSPQVFSQIINAQ